MNFTKLFEVSDIENIITAYDSLLYMIEVVLLMWVAKKVYDWVTPFKLEKQLVENDNKALGVSFAGYLLSVGIIVWSSLSSPDSANIFKSIPGENGILLTNMALVAIWGLVGIVLLVIARILNDKILLGAFDNNKEIIKDRNIGTGAVEFGAYVGSAFIIGSVIGGEGSGNIVDELIQTLIFFTVGQIAFIIFSKIYQKITKYDMFKELEENDNQAVGVAFGLTLVAVGMLLAKPIEKSDSLVYFFTWFAVGGVFIIIMRTLVDKIILPMHKIDDEIAKDKNWGIALIEGSLAIVTVILFNAAL